MYINIYILTDSINVWLSIWSAGTCSIGLISRNSLECCSPPPFIKLTGFISYGISFKFNAVKKIHIILYKHQIYVLKIKKLKKFYFISNKKLFILFLKIKYYEILINSDSFIYYCQN